VDRRIVVCVNLSPVQFRRPQHLVETVKQVLLKTGLEPQRLYLEITESLLMEDTHKKRAAVRELADFGVKFSLDDFGVGYSSLAYMRHYPFSKIKIDKSFIDNIDSDQTSSAIIAAVCVLAERTGLEIVGEGIETLQQHVALLEFGLNLAQGYLYGKPAPFVAEVKARVVNG
jgi:EAL domain-containing protein (putative c-di-GMP-specific phosphodiesterase class I)